ncbi:MAG: hypothetical protein P9L92_09260 [Candidatus Electryonea clarkiae]|nr:hypothetical protein [Candidatus Electryonea clarkiae]
MLFSGKNKLRPREFLYHPRFHDPNKDSDAKERIRFESLRGTRYRRKRSTNPALFLIVIVIIVILMWALKPKHFMTNDIDNVTLEKVDIPAVQDE